MPCHRRADGNYYCCAARPLPGNSCRAAWQLHGNLRCNCTAPRWLPRWLSCAGYAGCHATAMPHCSCCRAVATLHGYRSSCHALATHAPRSRGRRARERRRLRSFGGLLASSGAEKAKISYRFSGAPEASLVLGLRAAIFEASWAVFRRRKFEKATMRTFVKHLPLRALLEAPLELSWAVLEASWAVLRSYWTIPAPSCAV